MDIYNPSQAVPYLITSDGTKITAKIITEWTWNMDLYNTASVAHGLGASVVNICEVSVIIINDTDTAISPLNRVQDLADPNLLAGGVFEITDTYIVLRRRAGGLFDTVSYDSELKNRGIITIWYKI